MYTPFPDAYERQEELRELNRWLRDDEQNAPKGPDAFDAEMIWLMLFIILPLYACLGVAAAAGLAMQAMGMIP